MRPRRSRVVPTLGVTLVAIAAVAVAAWFVWLRPARAPDVVLVVIDTLRADRVGCYGRTTAATPVLDGLATRGVRFSNAVAHVPLTLPSHATIFTGTTPLVHGVRDNAGFVLGPGRATLAEVFAKAGYRTAAFVSGYPLDHRFGLSRGFEVYDDRFPRGNDATRPP